MVARLGGHVGRVARAARDMHRAGRRWRDWTGALPARRPRVWVHAPSIGEALTAEPVLTRLKTLFPDVLIAHTHTSDSVPGWPGRWTADRTDFLPFPIGRPVPRFAAHFSPDVLICPRADIWPTMVRAARRLQIPVAIVGGAIRDGSSRTSGIGRRLTGSMVKSVAAIGSVSMEDRARWIKLGAPKRIVHVTGDPRDQHVLDHVPDETVTASLRRWLGGTPCLVAGSVEPSDVQTLQRALMRLVSGSKLKAVLAPHRPTRAHLATLEATLENAGITTTRWTPDRVPPPEIHVVVVATTGHLRDLYRVASLGYVGGGFDAGGLHSVAEAAAYGVPTAVGPQIDTSTEVRFRDRGASVLRSASPGDELGSLAAEWLRDPDKARGFGLQGRESLSDNAADLSVEMLLPLCGGVRDS